MVRMVHDADDQERVALDSVENSVSPVDQAADVLAEFCMGRARKRKSGQSIEGRFKAEEIFVGDVRAELLQAVFANIDQVGARRLCRDYSKHGGMVVRQ